MLDFILPKELLTAEVEVRTLFFVCVCTPIFFNIYYLFVCVSVYFYFVGCTSVSACVIVEKDSAELHG